MLTTLSFLDGIGRFIFIAAGGFFSVISCVLADENDDLFPFDTRERSRAGAALNVDSVGGAGGSAHIDLAFLSGTRLMASGGGYVAQVADTTSGFGNIGIASNTHEDFWFSVHYEWQDRRLPVMSRCTRAICVEDANQIRQTVIEGVRTSFNYSREHWFAIVEPQSRRVTVASKNNAQDLFAYGARVSVGVFDIDHWDVSASAMRHWYTVDLSQFADGYRSPGGSQVWDLVDATQGLAVGYTWRTMRAGANASRSELAISKIVQYAYDISFSSPLGDSWSLDCSLGASVQSGYAPLWYFLPHIEFRW